MKRTFYKAVRLFHVWGGLGIGAIFCILSLSGSVLVLRPMIEDLLRPAWKPVSAARPAQVLTEAAKSIGQRWPSAKIVSVSPPSKRNPDTVEFGVLPEHGGEVRVFADARSGEVLGTYTLPWLVWLTNLHHHLLVESIGKKVVGFMGIFLLASSVSGLLIWARRGNRWRLFGIARTTSRQYTKYDLHRSVGVIGNLLLVFVSITGVMMVFPQTITKLLGGSSATKVSKASRRHKPATRAEGRATLEAYVAAAEQAVSGGEVAQLKIPDSPDRPVAVRVRVPGDLRQSGSARVNLEAGTARVLSVDQPHDWKVASAIVEAATPLHYVDWGGPGLRLAWSLIGLLPLALFVSGILMWLAPYAAKRKAAQLVSARRRAENDLVPSVSHAERSF